MHCVIAVQGRFWLGHARGVTVLDPRTPEAIVVQEFRLPGAIIHLMPLLSGEGAAYASESGGMAHGDPKSHRTSAAESGEKRTFSKSACFGFSMINGRKEHLQVAFVTAFYGDNPLSHSRMHDFGGNDFTD